MNWLIIVFFTVLLTSRLFSETLALVPKTLDLIDLAVIPVLAVMSLGGGQSRGVDTELHGKILRLSVGFGVLSVLSTLINFDRIHWAPASYFLFSFLEGPVLYLALNRLVKHKHKFGVQIAKFLTVMLIVQAAAVIFINFPMFLATKNPDVMSGTFGQNSYQFSVLLIIMGGFFLGRMRAGKLNVTYGIGIQGLVFIAFLLLQFRAATPAFFASYLVLVGILYGKRILKLGLVSAMLALFGFLAFSYVSASDYDLKFEDLLTLAQNPAMLSDFGKVLAYANTAAMYADHPVAVVLGTGPGTYVSRANYTFTVELMTTRVRGVGAFIRETFGDHDFRSDVFRKYIEPLYSLGAVFGSVQANNPASSYLASAAETGLPGLVIIAGMYIIMLRRSIRSLRYANAHLDPEILPLASALAIGVIYLLVISVLDNYMEIARVTLTIWLLFWTVTTLVQNRREEEIQQAIEHAYPQVAGRRLTGAYQ